MLKKFRRYLANKLAPYADLPPIKYERTNLDIQTLSCIKVNNKSDILQIPPAVIKHEIARELAYALEPYIKFETSEDSFIYGGVEIRGTIRVVKER